MIPSCAKIRPTLAFLLASSALAIAPSLRGQALTSPLPDDSVPVTMPGSGPAFADEEDDPGPPLMGRLEGNNYIPPTGAYRLPVPVLPELGGFIDDSEYVVTFHDDYGTHMSIGCFPLDANLRAEETKRGRKEFLIWYFQNFIQADFQRTIPGSSVEPNARFISSTHDGALLTQLLLPNGSVFNNRVFIFPPKPAPVAKRGNLLFVKNDFVYVLSIEMADRIFQYSTYAKTAAEENDLLRTRLYDLLGHFVFAPGATPPAATGTGAGLPAVSFPVAPPPAPAPASASGGAK